MTGRTWLPKTRSTTPTHLDAGERLVMPGQHDQTATSQVEPAPQSQPDTSPPSHPTGSTEPQVFTPENDTPKK